MKARKLNGHEITLGELTQYVPQLPDQLAERERGELPLSQVIYPYVWQLYNDDENFKKFIEAVTNEQSRSGNIKYDDAYAVQIVIQAVRDGEDKQLLKRLQDIKAIKIGNAIQHCLAYHKQQRAERLRVAHKNALAALTAQQSTEPPTTQEG